MSKSLMIKDLLSKNALLILQYSFSSLGPLIVVPHIINTIELTNFGELTISLTIATYGSLVVQYGFHFSAPKAIAEFAHDRSHQLAVWKGVVNARFSLFASLFGLISLAWAMGYLEWPRPFLVMIAFLTVLGITLNSTWMLQVADRYHVPVAFSIMGVVLGIILAYSLVRERGDIHQAMLVFSLPPLLVGVATWMYVRFSLFADVAGKAVKWWTLVTGSWLLFLSQLVASLYSAAGPFVVALTHGAEAAGTYGAVERLGNAVSGAAQLSYVAVYPRLAQHAVTRSRMYWKMISLLTGLHVGGMVVLVLVWAWLGDFITYGYLGAAGAEQGTPLFRYFLLWVGLSYFGPLLTGHLVCTNRTRTVWFITAAVLVVSMATGVHLTQAVGPHGWVMGLCFGQFVVLFVFLREFVAWWIREGRDGGNVC